MFARLLVGFLDQRLEREGFLGSQRVARQKTHLLTSRVTRLTPSASAVSSDARNSGSRYFSASNCWWVEIGTMALPIS